MDSATAQHVAAPDLAGCRESLTHLRVAVVDGGTASLYCAHLFAAHGARVAIVGAPPAPGDDLRTWLCERSSVVPSLSQVPWTADLLVVDGSEPVGPPAPDASTVVLSLSWFAPDGPHRDVTGSDEVIWAMSGLAFGIGDPDGPPVLPRGCAPQLLAGLEAFTAGLAALLHEPGRRPGTVQVNVHETMVLLAETAGVRARNGAATQTSRLGVNRFGATHPTGSYRTADGWVGLTCLTPSQWRSTCAVIGRDDLADDPRFVTSTARVHHADELDALLAPALAQRSTADLVAHALRLRLPLCPMPEPGDLPAHEHWRTRQSFAPVGSGPALAPTLPTRAGFTGHPVPRWRGDQPDDGPLSGLRVADFTMGWAGPLVARLLGDLGADVVKVEHDQHPDWWRGWDGPDGSDPPSTEMQPHFNAMNRNKRGVSFDLGTDEGRARARALIATADLVVDNFAAGVMDGLGLGSDVQRRLNPDVISLSLPPFGSAGPLSAMRAYGTTVEQSSGLPHVNGCAAWPPSLVHVALGDPVAGMYAGAAALVALAARAHRGGAVVEVSQVECLFQLAAEHIIEATAGRPVERLGNRRPGLPLSCVVTSGDDDADWLYVAVGDDGWSQTCALVGVPASAALCNPDTRRAEADAVAAAVAAWSRGRPTDQVVASLRAAGAVAAVVRPPAGVGRDAQHEACSMWGTLERPHVGVHWMAHPPFRFDGRRTPLRRPAPLLGQHTPEVLAELTPVEGTTTRGDREAG